MLLDREGLLEALRALDTEVFVVGGAALALAYDARRATVDVDAIFVPAAEVRSAAARVAERLDLEADRLNDGAKAFMPGSDPARIGVFEGEHLSVAAASPRYLLAMKLLASRLERDQDDIRSLYDLLGFSTAAEGIDLVESAYPGHTVAPRVQFLLEEMFPGDARQIEKGAIVRKDAPGIEL